MAIVGLKRKSTGIDSRIWDRIGNVGVIIMASLVVLSLVAVFTFIGVQAPQTFTVSHISVATFFTSKDWNNSFGAAVLIVGSLSLVVLGLLIAVPLSLGIAFFITEIAPPWLGRLLRNVVELFLGIPSVIFGLLGVLIVIPFVKSVLDTIFGDPFFTTGNGIFAAGIVVSFMVLPTITTISIDSLRAIPQELREGSLALGATRWQTMTKTLLPGALPGIMTGVILGAARILGETIAVALVIGGSAQIFGIDHLKDGTLFIGTTSVLTNEIFKSFGEATPDSTIYHAIFTLSFLLLAISAILVYLSRLVTSRSVYK
jgi:phosphate transport system permease protein